MQSNCKSILVVEDDLSFKPALKRMIQKIAPGAQVDWRTSAEGALAALKESPRDVVLTDVMLEGTRTGLDLVEECYRSRISANFLMISSLRGLDTKLPFLSKPFAYADLAGYLAPYLAPVRAAHKRVKQNALTHDHAMQWLLTVLLFTLWAWVFHFLVESPTVGVDHQDDGSFSQNWASQWKDPELFRVAQATLDGGLTPYLRELDQELDHELAAEPQKGRKTQ